MKTMVMKRSDRDKKREEQEMQRRFSIGPESEDYPYGMRLRLDHPELQKLGVDQLPRPGDKYQVGGEFHVTGTRQEDTDKNSDRHVEGVLHSFGMEPMASNSATRDRSIRDEIEDALHRARGTTASTGRIGARLSNGNGGA